MCNSARAASQLAPTTTTATSPRPRTGRTLGAKAARAGRHGQGAGRGRPAARPTSTELRHTNVPFSHPSEVYPQKDGRKVRSRDEAPFTLGRAQLGSSSCSLPSRRARSRGPCGRGGRSNHPRASDSRFECDPPGVRLGKGVGARSGGGVRRSLGRDVRRQL